MDRSSRARWMDVLFMIGSFCFALGAVPGYASLVDPNTVVVTFFVGSLFFTSAAALQLSLATGGWRDPNWAGSAVQFVGTLWFNINTFAARKSGLDAQQEDLRVWTPDVVGSICFLIASGFAIAALDDRSWGADRPWWVSALNMLGSIFFMASAIAAFVVPDSGDLLDAALANSGTFFGAICFLVAARIDLVGQKQEATPVG
jgi:hypothetical protein